MAWEWRTFVPFEEGGGSPQRHAVDALFRPGLPVEEREDVYIPVRDDCGLKLRHGTEWEVKMRVDVDDHTNGAEQWRKWKFGSKSDMLAVGQEQGWFSEKEIEAIHDSARYVNVKKKRVVLQLEGLALERTEIVAQLNRSLSNAPRAKRHISFCVEGDQRALLELLQSDNGRNVTALGSPMGYPAYVLSLRPR